MRAGRAARARRSAAHPSRRCRVSCPGGRAARERRASAVTTAAAARTRMQRQPSGRAAPTSAPPRRASTCASTPDQAWRLIRHGSKQLTQETCSRRPHHTCPTHLLATTGCALLLPGKRFVALCPLVDSWVGLRSVLEKLPCQGGMWALDEGSHCLEVCWLGARSQAKFWRRFVYSVQFAAQWHW